MKKFSCIVLALFMVTGGSAFASCPTAPSFYSCCGTMWVDWTQDASCYTLDSGISSATVGCYGATGWQYGSSFISSAYTSFTPNSSQMYNANNWWATTHVDFTSPSGSVNDQVSLWAVVLHNGSYTSHLLFSWNGTQGSHSGCSEVGSSFSASAGDTITIMVSAENGSGTATIRAGVPHITNNF